MVSFTPDDLLLYLYNETKPAQTFAIEKALQSDWSLREKLQVLNTSMLRLDSIMQSPRTEAVQNIMKHAGRKSKQEVY
jgi:hypothetical protein